MGLVRNIADCEYDIEVFAVILLVLVLVETYVIVLTIVVDDVKTDVDKYMIDGDNVNESTYELVFICINVLESFGEGDAVIELDGTSRYDEVSILDDVIEGDGVSEFTFVNAYV